MRLREEGKALHRGQAMTPETIPLPRETVEAYVALMRVIEEKCEPWELLGGECSHQGDTEVCNIVAAWRVARKAGG